MVEKDVGFVLRRHNFRETSVIASLYTLRFGKITGILKGFYTQKKEFSSNLDIFSLNELVFYPKKRDIWLISFTDLVHDYDFLRKDIAKATVAALFLNLIDRTMQPWDVNYEVFALLKNALLALEQGEEKKICYMFLIKFLTISGFKPEFNKCIMCHGRIQEESVFSVSRGGLVCGDCHGQVGDARKISKETISSLVYIQNSEFSLMLRLNPSRDCEKEITYILREFLCYHLDFDIQAPAQRKRLPA
ncbi:MAG: DNA repair protein RecO [Candidatus Omnitrophota bacterium]